MKSLPLLLVLAAQYRSSSLFACPLFSLLFPFRRYFFRPLSLPPPPPPNKAFPLLPPSSIEMVGCGGEKGRTKKRTTGTKFATFRPRGDKNHPSHFLQCLIYTYQIIGIAFSKNVFQIPCPFLLVLVSRPSPGSSSFFFPPSLLFSSPFLPFLPRPE